MKRELRIFPGKIEVRAKENSSELPKIGGYGAVFNTLSEELWGFREQVAPGAFAESIEKDDIRALIDHIPAFIIGRNVAGTLTLSEDDQGLLYEVSPPDNTNGRNIVESVRRGDVSQSSIGFYTLDESWEKKDGIIIRTLSKIQLFDVSPVTYPAYPTTSVDMRSLWPEGRPDQIEIAIEEIRKQAAGNLPPMVDVEYLRRRVRLAEVE